jgi:hypothetical protein
MQAKTQDQGRSMMTELTATANEDKMELTDDQLSRVIGGGSSKGDRLPTETVTFSYGEVVWSYTKQK